MRRLFPLALLAVLSAAPAGAEQTHWTAALRQPPAWYGGAEARTLAARVLAYQTGSGGWPKNTDFANPPTAEFLAAHATDSRAATIDNNATTTPLRFLANVVAATADEPTSQYRAAFERGFDYLLAAQYENGGWPQYFPLRKGYHTHITYNDNAMVNVLTLLRDAATGEPPYVFLDEPRRARAAAAVARGVDCILRTQIREHDRLTVWCAQHDEITLAPAWARSFEPPSLSGSESVGIVRFLMSLDAPSPAVIASIESAVAWFEKVKITGLRVEAFTDTEGKEDRRIVPDPAAPPLWARFYELGTERPIFAGRDKTIRDSYAEIERERRVGYAYYGTWAASLLERDYVKWRQRHRRP